jgi:hypothetical protein
MSSYVIEIPERTLMGKHLIPFLKSLSIPIIPVKSYLMQVKQSKSGLEEAIEDLEMGRVTKYKNVEEYKKEMRKKFGYV